MDAQRRKINQEIKRLQKENRHLKKQLQKERTQKIKRKYKLADNQEYLESKITMENEHNLFFDLSLDLFCIANFEGYFVRVNSAWEKLLGYTSAELTSTKFFDFVHPEDREKTISRLKDIQKGDNILNFENRYRCKNGNYRWLLWSFTYISDKEVTYAVARDITDRKEIEEKLCHSKEELLYITNSLPVGVSYIDNQRRYRFLNTMQEKWINGLRNGSREDIIGKYIWEILGEEFYKEFAKPLIDKVFEGEEVFYENTINFNPEEMKNIEGRLVPDFDENGKFKGYFCIITDVTQQKQDSLKIQEQLTTIESTIDGICVFKNDELTYANISFLRMFGYENQKDILGKNWSVFHPHLEIKRFKNDIFPVFKNHKSWQGETIGIKKDGTTFYKEISLTLLEDNTIIAICRDVSERKQIEQSLRIAEENYRGIFENALEGIFQSTPEGCYLSVNPAMAKIHGYNSPEEMIVKVQSISQKIYVDKHIREKFKLLLENQGYIKNFNYQIYRRDGQIIWLEENTRAVRDNCGKLLYYEGIVQDITERKLREKMLTKQIEELTISIDQNKRQHEVNSIAESDYFQELKANLNQLRVKS